MAVLVSGGGTNLQAIFDARDSGILRSGRVELVVSGNPAAFALERAKTHGVETALLPPGDFEPFLRDLLRARGIELIVLAGFMKILSADFVSAYPKRILNVHPSLIPSFCGKGFYGRKVHEAALACGVKVTGATVHFVNEVTDGGEILLQKAVEVLPDDTAESLQLRVMEQAEWVLLPRACEEVSILLQLAKENIE
jgi:phosphoribosylglycinamide formyltransferase-1